MCTYTASHGNFLDSLLFHFWVLQIKSLAHNQVKRETLECKQKVEGRAKGLRGRERERRQTFCGVVLKTHFSHLSHEKWIYAQRLAVTCGVFRKFAKATRPASCERRSNSKGLRMNPNNWSCVAIDLDQAIDQVRPISCTHSRVVISLGRSTGAVNAVSTLIVEKCDWWLSVQGFDLHYISEKSNLRHPSLKLWSHQDCAVDSF